MGGIFGMISHGETRRNTEKHGETESTEKRKREKEKKEDLISANNFYVLWGANKDVSG